MNSEFISTSVFAKLCFACSKHYPKLTTIILAIPTCLSLTFASLMCLCIGIGILGLVELLHVSHVYH